MRNGDVVNVAQLIRRRLSSTFCVQELPTFDTYIELRKRFEADTCALIDRSVTGVSG